MQQEPEKKRRKLSRKEIKQHSEANIHITAFVGNLARLGSLFLEYKLKGQTDPLDAQHRSPLHYACWGGRIECIQYLIEQGADINLKDVDGETPLSLGLKENCSPAFNKFIAELMTVDQGPAPIATCREEIVPERSFSARINRKRPFSAIEEVVPSADLQFILELPADMICSIFSFLDASMFFIARYVCKQWYRIFSDTKAHVWPFVSHVNTKKLDPFFSGQTLVNALNELTSNLVSLEFRHVLPLSIHQDFTTLTKLTNLINFSYDSGYIHRKLFNVAASSQLIAAPFVPYAQIRSFDFRSFCDFMNFNQLELCTALRELHLSPTSLRWGSTQGSELTLMKLTQLETLSLTTDDPLVLRHYSSLKYLELKVYQVIDAAEYQFVIDGLIDVLGSNPNLELLRLSIFKYWRSNRYSVKFLRSIPSLCLNLKVLECEQFLVGSDSEFAAVAKACTNLEILSVDNATRSLQFWKNSKIGDATLMAIANCCPNFRRLCAAKCHVTDRGVQALIDKCPNLEAAVFSSASIRQLKFENKARLRYVKLPGSGALNSIRITDCPLLKQFHVPDCSTLTDLHIERSGRALSLIVSCGSSLSTVRMVDVVLSEISATACYQFEHVTVESKSGLGVLEFPYCHQLKTFKVLSPLEHINLDGCQQLRELDVFANQLETIHLSECHQLSDEQIHKLVKESTGDLRVIDLRYNSNLSAATVRAFATHTPHVKELLLSYCVHVTEEALLHVLAKCHLLTSMHVSGLPRVTDKLIDAALKHPNLTLLNVACCPSVSHSYKKIARSSKLSLVF